MENWNWWEVDCWLVPKEWCPPGLLVCLPLVILFSTIKYRRSFLLALVHPGGLGERPWWWWCTDNSVNSGFCSLLITVNYLLCDYLLWIHIVWSTVNLSCFQSVFVAHYRSDFLFKYCNSLQLMYCAVTYYLFSLVGIFYLLQGRHRKDENSESSVWLWQFLTELLWNYDQTFSVCVHVVQM